MARRRKQFDKELFEKLCAENKTKKQIAEGLNVGATTLTRWVREEYDTTISEMTRRLSNKEPSIGGRPRAEIDQKTFENLCKIQCTKEEICGVFDVNDSTLTRFCKRTYGLSFAEVFKIKSAPGKASLRRMQFKGAERGNTAMLIWLGKQYLGQKDRIEEHHDASDKVADALKGLINDAPD